MGKTFHGIQSNFKMIKVESENPFLFKYKTSYADKSFNTNDPRKKCRKSFNDLKLCALQNTSKITNEKKKLDRIMQLTCYSQKPLGIYHQLEVDTRNAKKMLILIMMTKLFTTIILMNIIFITYF